ncbi:hypothetical protein TKK_0002747 [Trichogramma kaykai]
MSKTIFEDDILAALQKYFNYKSLRPGQQPIIQNILRSKDIVVSMESGFGKSVCYQLAGLLRDGVVIVVSHSPARMEEKSTELASFKTVKTVCLINDAEDKDAGDLRNDLIKKRDIIQKLKGTKAAGAARVKFLFTTFDCLGSTSLKETLIDLHKNKLLQIFVVDAAYSKYPCLSEKKNADFDSIKNIYHNIPIVCLVSPTSTRNLSKIEKLLHLKNTYIVNEPSVQNNLTFKVMYRNEYPLEITKLIIFLRKDYSKKRGIIYCDDENEFKVLKKGCIINLRQWTLADIGEITLCTSDDEPNMKDIDFIVHIIMPSSLDLYMHQVFKASRSSSKCDCILFYHVDDFERVLEKSKKKIQQATAEHKDDFAKSLIKAMHKLFDIIVYAENISICRQIFLLQYLNYKNYVLPCGQCDSCEILKPGFVIEISDVLRKILMAIWTINRQQRKRNTKKSSFNANLNSVISLLLGNVEKSYENTWVTKEWFFGSFGSWDKSILSLFIFTLLAKKYLQMNHFYDEQFEFSQNLIITTEGQDFVKSNSQHNLNISMKNSSFVKWTDPTSIEVQLYADLLSAAESYFKHTENSQVVEWYMYFIEQLYLRIPSTWDEYKLVRCNARVKYEKTVLDEELYSICLQYHQILRSIDHLIYFFKQLK